MSLPRVSIAIPTYQRDLVLLDTINSVLEQDFDAFELIIVDQTETLNKKIDEFFKNRGDERIRYFKVSPPSLPAARNFAIEKARADIVIFIDDDVILKKNFIQHHLNAHNSSENIKAVAGRIKSQNETKPVDSLFYFDWFGFEKYSFNYPYPQESMAFQGCNFSLKKETVKELGGFDTNYQKSAIREDSDFAHRLSMAGYKIWYEPKAELIHLMAFTGGCRVNGGLVDSLTFYENDLYFTLKTKSVLHWLVIYLKKFVRYIRIGTNRVDSKRIGLFFKGLYRAMNARRNPDRIVQKTVYKIP